MTSTSTSTYASVAMLNLVDEPLLLLSARNNAVPQSGCYQRERFINFMSIQTKTLHQRRGIAKANSDHHAISNHGQVPAEYVTSVRNAIQRYNFSTIPTVTTPRDTGSTLRTTPRLESTEGLLRETIALTDRRTSPVPISHRTNDVIPWRVDLSDGDSNNSTKSSDTWKASGVGEPIGWVEGNTTDRTSLSSSDWGDDVCEFDRLESNRVGQMFEDIKNVLFESTGGTAPRSTSNSSSASGTRLVVATVLPSHLSKECGEWRSRFPHLRLVGEQVCTPQDQGFSLHPTKHKTSSKSTAHSSTSLSTGAGSDSSDAASFSSSSSSFSIAGTNSLMLAGYRVPIHPPLNNSLRKSGNNEVIENSEHPFWEEVYAQDGSVEEMIAVDFRQTEEESVSLTTSCGIHVHHRHHGYPPLTPNAALTDAVTSSVFDILWTEVVGWMRPLFRASLHRSIPSDTFPEDLPVEPPGAAVARLHDLIHVPPHLHNMDLSDVLHISSKALQHRERSFLHDIPESPGPQIGNSHGFSVSSIISLSNGRPLSSRTMSSRRVRGRLLSLERSNLTSTDDDNLSSITPVPNSVGATGCMSSISLVPNATQQGSGFRLLGRSINPAVERSLMSPNHLIRSGTLPPVGSGSLVLCNAVSSNEKKNDQRRNSRGSSGRPSSFLQLDRPSTTQTTLARSEIHGIRRSNTPLSLLPSSVVPADAAHLLKMSVKGIRAGNLAVEENAANSKVQGAPSIHWSAYTPSNTLSNPYRRAKQVGNIVR